MLLAYIYCSNTHRVHFLDKARRAVTFRSGRSRAGSRTRRSPRVEQVEPRLAVDGDQPLQQAVARLDGRPAVGAVAGLVHAPLAGVAPPVRGEPVLLPEAAPLERQPRLAHAEAAGDGGARLGVVPRGESCASSGWFTNMSRPPD